MKKTRRTPSAPPSPQLSLKLLITQLCTTLLDTLGDVKGLQGMVLAFRSNGAG